MGIKNLSTIKPVKVKIDAKGRPINIYRGGILDSNKYAKLTPSEKADRQNLNNRSYLPDRAKEDGNHGG